MKHKIQTAAFLALTLLAGSQVVWSADTATDAAQVKLQSFSKPEVQALAEKTGGYKPKDVEINSTAHQMTITIINSKLNNVDIEQREAEASKIVSSIALFIADKPEFSKLPVIHINYVNRQGKKLKNVQQIDFFQAPTGAYVLHKT